MNTSVLFRAPCRCSTVHPTHLAHLLPLQSTPSDPLCPESPQKPRWERLLPSVLVSRSSPFLQLVPLSPSSVLSLVCRPSGKIWHVKNLPQTCHLTTRCLMRAHPRRLSTLSHPFSQSRRICSSTTSLIPMINRSSGILPIFPRWKASHHCLREAMTEWSLLTRSAHPPDRHRICAFLLRRKPTIKSCGKNVLHRAGQPFGSKSETTYFQRRGEKRWDGNHSLTLASHSHTMPDFDLTHTSIITSTPPMESINSKHSRKISMS